MYATFVIIALIIWKAVAFPTSKNKEHFSFAILAFFVGK